MSHQHSLPAQGGIASRATGVEVMDLTEDSMTERQKHEALLIDLEAKKRGFGIDVPTLPHEVRDSLRKMGLPVRLFGENLADIRDRLRMEMARMQVVQEGGVPLTAAAPKKTVDEDEQVTKYTRATPELIKAREHIAKFSLNRAQERLAIQHNRQLGAKRKRARLLSPSAAELVPNDPAQDEECVEQVSRLDDECTKLYKSVRNMALEGSQYGDPRALSAICTTQVAGLPLIATGSWSATIKLWDGSSPQLDMLSEKTMAHEDRIMSIAMQPPQTNNADQSLVATASIDLTAKLWNIQKTDDVMSDDDKDAAAPFHIKEVAHLKGHEARLCSVAFHPTGSYVATTSFDHTWRLWDVESGGTEILLQDGHARETYGVGFHPDGSLCSTTDFDGVVQVWDLRTGKSIHHFLGHARRVLCSEFSPNGFQLATAGDDGTIKIWDLRRRKQSASIPAHSNLITQIRFANDANNGEYLASSSFDGTAKVWSTRDWKLLSTLRGHDGKVMGVDVLNDSIVTCGYDKTLKLWS